MLYITSKLLPTIYWEVQQIEHILNVIVWQKTNDY